VGVYQENKRNQAVSYQARSRRRGRGGSILQKAIGTRGKHLALRKTIGWKSCWRVLGPGKPALKRKKKGRNIPLFLPISVDPNGSHADRDYLIIQERRGWRAYIKAPHP